MRSCDGPLSGAHSPQSFNDLRVEAGRISLEEPYLQRTHESLPSLQPPGGEALLQQVPAGAQG